MTQPKRQAVINRFDGTEHAFLSNFYESPIVMPSWHTTPGWTARTVEHAFQAAKTENVSEAQMIMAAATPGKAKRLGRRVTLRPGWDEGRDAIMRALLVMKFAVGTELSEMLLDTGDAELVEGNTWGDVYWGVCDGVGQNKLGEMLMELRGGLRVSA